MQATTQQMLLIIALCAFGTTSVMSHAEGKVYRHTKENGHQEFSDRKWHDGFVRIKRTWKGWVEVQEFKNWRDNRRRYQPYILSAAKTYKVPVQLINSVIHTESYFNPEIESSAGAVGLMQLMPATAQRFSVLDRRDPKQNIYGGTQFLSVLLKKYNNDLKLALAAYNAGEGAVKKYGNKIPPYPETQRYVEKVLGFYQEYQKNQIVGLSVVQKNG